MTRSSIGGADDSGSSGCTFDSCRVSQKMITFYIYYNRHWKDLRHLACEKNWVYYIYNSVSKLWSERWSFAERHNMAVNYCMKRSSKLEALIMFGAEAVKSAEDL